MQARTLCTSIALALALTTVGEAQSAKDGDKKDGTTVGEAGKTTGKATADGARATAGGAKRLGLGIKNAVTGDKDKDKGKQ